MFLVLFLLLLLFCNQFFQHENILMYSLNSYDAFIQPFTSPIKYYTHLKKKQEYCMVT